MPVNVDWSQSRMCVWEACECSFVIVFVSVWTSVTVPQLENGCSQHQPNVPSTCLVCEEIHI